MVLAVLSFIWCYCKISFLILLFSTYLGCPHCKKIKPEFSEVAKEVNTENKVIKYSFISTRVAQLPQNLAPMKRMKTSSTCVSEKSFCFTRSLLSVGNKHKFWSNFPCFKSESHFYPWKQARFWEKSRTKRNTLDLFISLIEWILAVFFFCCLFFFFFFLFFFGGGGFRRKFSFSTILLFRSLVPWVRWIALWMVIFVLNRKSNVIPHVSLLLPVIFQ